MIAGNSKICICDILNEQTGPRKIKRLRPIETGFGHPGHWREPHQRISSVNRGEQEVAETQQQAELHPEDGGHGASPTATQAPLLHLASWYPHAEKQVFVLNIITHPLCVLDL